MRKLKRSECAMLHLGLRHYWYSMIESGEKCVEFREAKPYWQKRIANWESRRSLGLMPVIEFQSGYGRFSPRMTFIAGGGMGVIYEYLGADVPVQHKKLGEFQKARYALLIGERVMLED